jgi:capsular polysaccharide biosynthesis protein
VLELQRNLFVLRRWWWLLLLGALVGGGVAYGLTKVLVKTTYEAVAIVSTGAAPEGQQGTYIAASGAPSSGDLLINAGVVRGVQRLVPGISTADLQNDLTGTASQQGCVSLDTSTNGNQCQLLLLHVQWPDPALAIRLANAVAAVFMQQERVRLEQGYALYHRGIAAQERALTQLIRATPGKGAAGSWLQAQYANTLSGLYDKDANARVQSSVAIASLEVAKPATKAVKASGPKASVNGALGALLGLLVAWIVAFLVTRSYGDEEEAAGPRPVLSQVRD